MIYKDTGFRAVYNQFTVFDLEGPFKEMNHHYSPEGDYNCVLIWGYNDRSQGMMLEVMAFGIEKEDNMYYFDDPDTERRDTVRMEQVQQVPFTILDDSEKQLMERYKDKIKILDEHYENHHALSVRKDFRIDDLRDPFNPDIVQVLLLTDFCDPEGCNVIIDSLGDQVIIGRLMEDPKGDFGLKSGDQVEFLLYPEDDDCWVLASDMCTGRSLCEKDTEGGQLLEKAIHDFNLNSNEQSLVWVLNVLAESRLTVPSTNGRHGVIRSGKELYIPAFTRKDQMNIPDDMAETVEKSTLQVIAMAEDSKERLKGIVINPFTEGFLLHKDLYKAVKEIKG